MKRLSLAIILIFLCFPIEGQLETGQIIEKNNYRCHISATRLGSSLVVTGEISGGNFTELLRIRVYLLDENGNSESVSAAIKRYNKSGRFSVKVSEEYGGNRWIATDVFISE